MLHRRRAPESTDAYRRVDPRLLLIMALRVQTAQTHQTCTDAHKHSPAGLPVQAAETLHRLGAGGEQMRPTAQTAQTSTDCTGRSDVTLGTERIDVTDGTFCTDERVGVTDGAGVTDERVDVTDGADCTDGPRH